MVSLASVLIFDFVHFVGDECTDTHTCVTNVVC